MRSPLKRYRMLLCLQSLSLCVPSAFAADAELQRVMQALAQRQHGHVSFVERKFIAILDQPVESSGELLFDAPDRLEKRTLRPKPEDLVLQGGIVTARRGKRSYVLDLQQYPQIVPFVESIRATLAGDQAALEKFYEVRFTGRFEHWTLDLKPREARLRRTVEQIAIEGGADRLHTVEINEPGGDRSVLTIGADVGQ